MNLARTYLETAYPDISYTRAHMQQLEAAGLLGWIKVLLRHLEAQRQNFVAPGTSVADAALALEEQQMAQFIAWREELIGKVGNASLRNVELVFTELTTPQAVTIHEQDNSYAIALDRRMTTFLGAVTTWAYTATGLEMNGVPPSKSRSLFLEMLANHVIVSYTKQPLPPDLEERELALDQNLGELDRQLIRNSAALAAKFVLYHELGHVHLLHFEKGEASHSIGTAEVSTFHQHAIEFDADAFANEHLMDKEGNMAAAVASKVAAPIYLLLLAMKEAMLPASDASIEARVRDHPPAAARARKLSQNKLPPAYLPQWEIYFQVPALLQLVYESSSFQAAARFFASSASSS
jgi:IrrE N-terminal-like domain